MYKFGKVPPRSLESFGVAGLLGEGCRIFYNNIFSSKHLGRVSDLLSARLKSFGVDELHLRTAILYLVFDAYQALEIGEPLTIECGLDSEKIAIGAAFVWKPGLEFPDSGITKRITEGNPATPLEKILVQLFTHSHRLLLRADAVNRKLEIVSVSGIPGLIGSEWATVPSEIEWMDLSNTVSAPKAEVYTELGDLDYPALLVDDLARGKKKAGGSQLDVEGHALADALNQERPGLTRVAGGKIATSSNEVIRVKGSGVSARDETVVKISVGSGDLQDRTAIVVKGESTPEGATSAEEVANYQQKIKDLEAKVAELEAEAGGEYEGEYEEDENRAKRFLKKIWPFSRKKAAQVEDEDEDEEQEESEEEAPSDGYVSEQKPESGSNKITIKAQAAPEPGPETVAPAVAPSPRPSAASGASANANAEQAAKSLEAEINTGHLSKTLTKARREAADIKKDLTSAKAKKWVDGLMQDLVAEKSRLQDLAKTLNLSIRQKEIEFRNKEQQLNEEIRRRDDMIRQKNTALSRVKEQLSESASTIEKLKSTTQEASEAVHYKQKYNQMQSLLRAAQEEKKSLSEKVDELRKILSVHQAKTHAPSSSELTALQSKAERYQKQAEDLKKLNQQLNDKLAAETKKQTTKPSAASSRVANAALEETKKRLDASMKMVTQSKKETERLQLRVEEMEQEQTRLLRELGLAQAEVKKRSKDPKETKDPKDPKKGSAAA